MIITMEIKIVGTV